MNENANQNKKQEILVGELDLKELEGRLSAQLEIEFAELSFLEEERKKIGSPDHLAKVVMDVAWEEFMNNIAATAGEDFIKDNRDLRLDLRNKAHIQTTENFVDGKISNHNMSIDYQKRFDEWQDNFQKNEDGTIKTNADKKNYKGNKPDQQILNKDARKPIDKDRPKGTKSLQMDHVVPAAEVLRDPEANAHLEKKEQIDFSNSEKNLRELDASANASKGDLPVTEWLESERDGIKPADRFNIDEEELRECDRIAREEYKRVKEEGKQKSIKIGKQSQKEEAFRISNKALRAVVMQLLAEFVKEIIRHLISWFKNAKKSIATLLESINSAIINFVNNLEKHLFNAGTTILTTVAIAIFGPIVRTLKKLSTMLKQGVKSLGEVLSYLKNPNNKRKSYSVLLLEVGKIVIVGAGAVGAPALGEAIEKGLMVIPVFAFEIPLLGSLASLVGLLLGSLIMGIIGAIVLNLMDKLIAKKRRAEITVDIINNKNSVTKIQQQQILLAEKKMENTKMVACSEIKDRHKFVKEQIIVNMEMCSQKSAVCTTDDSIIVTENTIDFSQMQKDLEGLI